MNIFYIVSIDSILNIDYQLEIPNKILSDAESVEFQLEFARFVFQSHFNQCFTIHKLKPPNFQIGFSLYSIRTAAKENDYKCQVLKILLD